MKAGRQHISWIDSCRVASIFGVIVIHASAVVVQDYSRIPFVDFISGVSLDSLARVSVPLFVMISGALLIPGPPAGNPLPRILRVTLPLVFWSLFYQAWVGHWTNADLDIISAFAKILEGPVMYHLWFVYMIVGLYLLLPIFQVLHQRIVHDRRMGLYLLTLWTIVSCIPSFYAIPFLPHLQVGVVAGYSGYFLLGAYLAHLGRPSRCAMLISLAIFLTASAFTAALTILWTVADGHPNETAFTYFFPTVAIGTVALFRVFSFYQPGPIAGRVFSRLAALCFPVYFMHLVMLDILRGGMLGVAITPYFTQPIVALFVWSALTFTICAAISAVVRLLPGAARVVG